MHSKSKILSCQDNFMRTLFDGKIEMSDKEIKQRLFTLNLAWICPPCVVADISPRYVDIEYANLDFFISEYREYISVYFKKNNYQSYSIIDSYSNIKVLLLLEQKDISITEIDKILGGLYKKLITNFNLELFIGIGSVVSDLRLINQSAYEAHEMLAYKYQYAAERVVNISNIVKFRHNITLGNDIAFDRVLGCFRDGDLVRMSSRLDELIEQIRYRPKVSNYSIRRMMIEVTVHILNSASNAGVDVEKVLNGLDPYRWILEQTHTEVLKEWLMQISAELLELIQDQKKISEKRVIRDAIKYIGNNIDNNELGLQQVSDEVGLSNTYLSQLFKEEIGIGINQYISESRVERAKQLLLESELKTSEIALQCGFSSVNYFFQVFKKCVGMTPIEYKRNNIS